MDGRREIAQLEVQQLLIQIKKKPDGSAALSCHREDGSVTWQRQEGQQGRFFPRHDLTHYVVESVLGLEQCFYGLVASGWELTDFLKPYPRGAVPPEALASEVLVGFLDQERAGGVRWSAAEFNRSAESYFAGHGIPGCCELTDEQLAGISQLRAKLFAEWDALEAGAVLELFYPRPSGS
jgi:hypothetical protein